MAPSAFQSGVLLSKSFPQQPVLDAMHLPHQHDILTKTMYSMGCEFGKRWLAVMELTDWHHTHWEYTLLIFKHDIHNIVI